MPQSGAAPDEGGQVEQPSHQAHWDEQSHVELHTPGADVLGGDGIFQRRGDGLGYQTQDMLQELWPGSRLWGGPCLTSLDPLSTCSPYTPQP